LIEQCWFGLKLRRMLVTPHGSHFKVTDRKIFKTIRALQITYIPMVGFITLKVIKLKNGT